jgi:hypothetical protein
LGVLGLYLLIIIMKTEFDYILLLDNDGWILPKENKWYEKCLELFNSDPKIGSLGLQNEKKQGYFSMEKNFDHSYDTRTPFEDFEIYDTVFYAAFRLDKFSFMASNYE